MAQNWWQKNLPNQVALFKSWVGDEDAATKVTARNHARGRGYRSVLDVGCGLGQVRGYSDAGIDYRGVDSCGPMVERINDPRITVARVDEIPVADASVDMVLLRHVLEHLPHFGLAMNEACRIARHEVVVVFFMPLGVKDVWSFKPRENYYENQYGRVGFEWCVKQMDRVRAIEYQWVGPELLAHVLMQPPQLEPGSFGARME